MRRVCLKHTTLLRKCKTEKSLQGGYAYRRPGTIHWTTNTSAIGRLKWLFTFGDLARVPEFMG